MTVAGSNESWTIPIQTCTKVSEIKDLICVKLGIERHEFHFFVKSGPTYKQLSEFEEMRSKVWIRGIKSWSRAKMKYPHPHMIIGAGHQGLRQALSFQKDGITNFTVYDRLGQVGGGAWVYNANPTSKLQTELGVYHLQYDEAYTLPKGISTWPSRQELLTHFHNTAEEYGLLPHVQLSTDVTKVETVKDKDLNKYDPKSCYYNCVVRSTLDEDAEDVIVKYSTVAMYPGALVSPKRKDYKGEEVFDGQIGYGMFNEFDYTKTKGEKAAVLGMGAFGIENVRTCLEHGCTKVELVARRKNLAMPRVISWWCNQSLYPPPGAMLMECMTPAYELTGDDHWSFYSVVSNKERTLVTIRQKSRFGIGDVYFLARYYEKVEVHVDEVKRFQPDALLLEGGDKLEVEHVVKVLGFHADETADKVMKVKEMVGIFPDSDHRRMIMGEPPGVDAGKFGGTSASPGYIQNAYTWSHFVNFPKDTGPVIDSGMLPRNKPNKDTGAPAYVFSVRDFSSISMVIPACCPGLGEAIQNFGVFNRERQIEAHPPEAFLKECEEDWYSYCRMFKAAGDDRPFPPYPYTIEKIRDMLERNDREGLEEQIKQQARAS
eukprot:gnl/TRDRNA2_/TRDRNA2_45032_c0_seq1.p1 gnl/TRDRNA2_/TRDRNA2_45032_c0~~gnl/TRDRNA2_/TRDRNA2_45032_c0_seq1.p1  ORF type:complete len:638 (+),score=112.49 gnl/TRDRNA2_/TRDRNA2_45032_c0_seq1:112-1914(+)